MEYFKNNKTYSYLFMIVIVLFGLFIRLKYFVGLNYCDDMAYSHYAARLLSHGEYFRGDILGIRIGIWFPIAFFYKILGINHFSLGLYTLFCSLANIVLIYFLGAILFNPLVGLFSSFLLSIYPLDVIYATWATPDVPLSFLQALAALLIIYKHPDEKNNKYLKALAGAVWGISILTNTSSNVFLFGIMGIYIASLLLKRKNIREVIIKEAPYFIGGVAFIILLEGLVFYRFSGDMFYRFSETFRHFGNKEGVVFGQNVDFMFYPRAMFLLDRWQPFGLNLANKAAWEYGWYFYLFVLSLLFLAIRRKPEDKNALILILWGLFYFLYLEYGSMSMTKYIGLHRLTRHLSVLTVPMILTCALFLGRLWNNGWGRKLASIMIGIFIISTSFISVHAIFGNLLSYREGNKIMVETLRRFDKTNNTVYYVHGSLGANMDFYARYRDFPYGSWRDIDNEDSFKEIGRFKDKEIYFVMKDFNRSKILKWLGEIKIKVAPLENMQLYEKYYLYRKI